MEGSESEAAFDALNLKPQLFINEILNSIDDTIDGAFDFCLQQASELTSNSNAETSDELAKGVSAIRHLTQSALDKRMEVWERYCLQHCFAVPDGFVLPSKEKQGASGDDLLLQGLADVDLDSQLNSLREKLAAVGKESAELQREIYSLEQQSALSSSYDASVAEARHFFEENSVQNIFQEIKETATKLNSNLEKLKLKKREDMEQGKIGKINCPSRKGHLARDPGFYGRLEDLQQLANLFKNT